MREIRFSRVKLGLTCLATSGLAYLFARNAYLDGSYFAGFLALILVIAAATAFALATHPKPAIRFDHRGVTLNKLFRSGHFAWSEVHDIRVQSYRIRYGLLPVGRVTYLAIKVDGDILDTSTFRFSSAMLAAGSGIEALCVQLQLARVAAVGEAHVAMKGAGHAGWGAAGGDAPRYVADMPTDGVHDRSPRAGLPTQPPGQPTPSPYPARPAFGRKAV